MCVVVVVMMYRLVIHAVVVCEQVVHPGHVEEGLEWVGRAKELGKRGARISVERVLRVGVVVIVVGSVMATHSPVSAWNKG